jgi:hypothetical protein
MSIDIPELTGAEAGLNSQRQIEIALQALVQAGGQATVLEIYTAIERYMSGAVLSRQGRDTLRSLLNRDAVKQGFIHPSDGSHKWHITDQGRTKVASLEQEILPEGLDEGNFDMGEYPIDSLLIRSEQRTVYDVVRRMEQGKYILDPDFQRDFVWPEDKQSKLIESALMRIPLPVFYLAENPDGKVVVVDGLQRLITFRRFLKDEFALRGLKGSSAELNKNRFSDLNPKLQNRLEDTQLVLYLIDSKVPDRARLDIFERVNSGVALSRQQMRNCLYVGPATRWLKAQAQSDVFLQATGNSLNTHTMRDREVINRFCAFLLTGVDGYRSIGANMDDFLAETLKKMNSMKQEQIDSYLTAAFERSMRNNYALFGRHAFRKHADLTGSRNVLNIALFDIYSVLMTRYSEAYVAAHIEEFSKRFHTLLENEDFHSAITFSTNDARRVELRFKYIKEYHTDLIPDVEYK